MALQEINTQLATFGTELRRELHQTKTSNYLQLLPDSFTGKEEENAKRFLQNINDYADFDH